MYATPRSSASGMPLLMHFTPRTKVQECQEEKFIYDELHQVIEYTMAGAKGTNSRKQFGTKKKEKVGYAIQTDWASKKDD